MATRENQARRPSGSGNLFAEAAAAGAGGEDFVHPAELRRRRALPNPLSRLRLPSGRTLLWLSAMGGVAIAVAVVLLSAGSGGGRGEGIAAERPALPVPGRPSPAGRSTPAAEPLRPARRPQRPHHAPRAERRPPRDSHAPRRLHRAPPPRRRSHRAADRRRTETAAPPPPEPVVETPEPAVESAPAPPPVETAPAKTTDAEAAATEFGFER
ncbi:MAG TPA: hypothetical protein VGG40_05375 [Solirubrobacterales bacterium]|jgi:hypothetical protein